MAWWHRRSLRARLMIIGVVGLALGLAAGGVALVAILGFTLQRTVDNEATGTARQVAALVDEGALPQPVPVAGPDLVQVVDGAGRVRAASIEADRLVPILRPAELNRARAGERLVVDGSRVGVEGPVRVVAVSAGTAADPQTVIVARPVADLARATAALRTTLLVAFPLLVLVLAAVAWRTVGATLRPVEALRRGAEEITGAGRAGQLPVPGSRDEIHRLAVTLNDMLARQEAARARQRAFVADAAHELRSPLANMRTQLEVAQRLGESTDWQHVGADLLADTGRLSRLVDDLLLLARADEDGYRRGSPAGPVDLQALLVSVGRDPAVGAGLGPHTAAVRVVDGPSRWTRGHIGELSRVLGNLVDNAVRYARTQVRLEAVTDGAYHVVTVTDDGPGVPDADRERVFERFTRLDEGRGRGGGGAGLGLAIVRELVRGHGGQVRLADAGPGLRVEVWLPAAGAGQGHTVRVGPDWNDL